ncbi:T9SS type A sorting domain-containing protein [Taibaiella lutea]|uniref:T9SS type A sorting domain-containing protein n=1 Tax=Taibaiella lutea TaxID=2608001 RepID=A0A5M6CCK6_9BACT|nr:T9SS type A sorting domain-containing protein [Taibaiella lutea]KAA5532190.1 T9SS type A sorting domain-containing protein [Taibaiella lutea]
MINLLQKKNGCNRFVFLHNVQFLRFVRPLFILSLLATAVTGFAQFNKSYLLSNRRLTPHSVMRASFGGIYATAGTYPDTAYSFYGKQHAILRLDEDGIFVDLLEIEGAEFESASHIIEAKNEQLLFAGYNTHEKAVIVVKLDKDLNVKWSLKIPAEWYVFANLDIIRQLVGEEDASGPEKRDEFYYIGYSDKTGDPAYPNDYAYCLAKIDENGNALWNNRYIMSPRPGFSLLQDKFGSLCGYTNRDDRKFKIALAGTRVEETPAASLKILGVLTVNDDGTVFDGYHSVYTSSFYEYKNPHISYDADNAVFIVSTMEVSGTPNVASDLNLIQITQNFSTTQAAIYSSDCENYNMAVYKARLSNEYLLGSTETACTLPGGGLYVSTFGLYRVDASSLGVNDFIRYNIYSQRPTSLTSNRNTFFVDHDDNSYMTSNKVYSPFQFDQQVLRTDYFGEACGAIHLTPLTRRYTAELRPRVDYKEEKRDVTGYEPIVSKERTDVFNCEDAPPQMFRAVAPDNKTVLPKVYPTILAQNEFITLQLTAPYLSGSTCSVFDVNGKLLLCKELSEQSGNNIQINVGEALSGIYLLQLKNKQGDLFTQKFIIK